MLSGTGAGPLMAELVEVSWALLGVSPRAIVGKHSKRHWFIWDDESLPFLGAKEGSGTSVDTSARALCGTLIPWIRVHSSNEGDCRGCLRVMRSRKWTGEAAETVKAVLGANYIADVAIGLMEATPMAPEGLPLYTGCSG